MSEHPTLVETAERRHARQRSFLHELGNVLAPIVGIAGVLRSKLCDCEIEDVSKLIEMLGRASRIREGTD